MPDASATSASSIGRNRRLIVFLQFLVPTVITVIQPLAQYLAFRWPSVWAEAEKIGPYFLGAPFGVASWFAIHSYRIGHELEAATESLKNLESQLSRTFTLQLKTHADEEEKRIRKLTRIAGELTGLHHILGGVSVSASVQPFVNALKRALKADGAAEAPLAGVSLAYSEGLLNVLEKLCATIEHPGLYLTAKIRTQLYRDVGSGATDSILRIEPMSLWPSGSEQPHTTRQWSTEFQDTLDALGARTGLRKLFVFLVGERPEVGLEAALRERFVQMAQRNMKWDVCFVNKNSLPRQFAHEAAGHHFVVDRKIDLFVDINSISDHDGAIPLNVFNTLQPPLRIKFLKAATVSETGATAFIAMIMNVINRLATDREQPNGSP